MEIPRKCTVEFVYAKLKTEVIRFIRSEITLNIDSDGDVYGFDTEEMILYDTFCNEMIRSIENTEINYEAFIKSLNDDELPF